MVYMYDFVARVKCNATIVILGNGLNSSFLCFIHHFYMCQVDISRNTKLFVMQLTFNLEVLNMHISCPV